METYIGVKMIEAEPCTYYDFLDKYRSKAYRNTVQPDNENKEGYLVKYPPDGYISWSPKDVFEEAYYKIDPERASRYGYMEQLKNTILHWSFKWHECIGGIEPSLADLLQSQDWKERVKGEYLYIKDKVKNLKDMLEHYVTHALGFQPNCSIELLTEQLNAMQSYLNILELRMKIEHID